MPATSYYQSGYAILFFDNAQQTRDYRHENGTGGWIFANDETKAATLFPPHMPPANIFHHPLTAGKSGRLIGNS